MKINLSAINFTGYGKPKNYKRVDDFLVRSAQPQAEEIVWMKKHRGVTDIFNFRRTNFDVKFDEQKLAESMDINYHSIPTSPRTPNFEDVKKVLNSMDEIKQRNGLAWFHCQAGADRTGFNALIYQVVNGLKNFDDAVSEMKFLGHHYKTYPELINTAADFIKQLKK